MSISSRVREQLLQLGFPKNAYVTSEQFKEYHDSLEPIQRISSDNTPSPNLYCYSCVLSPSDTEESIIKT